MPPYETQIPTEHGPLAGAVLLNQPEPEPETASLIEYLEEAAEYLRELRNDTADRNGGPAAAREFSIAITAIEDAQMRTNRGFAYLTRGRVTQADVQKEHSR